MGRNGLVMDLLNIINQMMERIDSFHSLGLGFNKNGGGNIVLYDLLSGEIVAAHSWQTPREMEDAIIDFRSHLPNHSDVINEVD